MNKVSKWVSPIALALAFGLFGPGAIAQVGALPTIERDGSSQAKISLAFAKVDDEQHLRISGELRKRFIRRGPIYGRLVISLLDAQGNTLQSEQVDYLRRGRDTGVANFSHVFEVPVAQVSRVLVTHKGIGE